MYEMKESGIEWIGQIPKHWKVSRLKYILDKPLQYGANETGVLYDATLPRYIRITDITKDNQLKKDDMLSLPNNISIPFILKHGDILFARSGATVGKTFLYKQEYGKSAFAGYLIKARINTKKSLYQYVYLYTLSKSYDIWKNQIFIQATIQNIGADKYRELYIPLPPLDEQKKIADFLDNKVTEIDNLIDDTKKLIDKYKEYKQSLITETVTKGLHSNVEMKDSGIEWIGQIPKHWEVRKNKYLLKSVYSGGTPLTSVADFYSDNEGINFVTIADMSNTEFVESTIKLITEKGCAQKKLKILNKGTILFSIYATIGAVAELKIPATINQAILALEPYNIYKEYYKYNLKAMNKYLLTFVSTNTQGNLNLEKVLNLFINFPPLDEQEEIVKYLDDKCSQLDSVIEEKQSLIEKLEEYKKSLIYEYVTGKKQV